jgi:GNAT superfamily N-acetyltransferase
MATWPLIFRRATTVDLETVIDLIEDAADWLRTQGTDQWARPWPSRAARDCRILADLHARRTWIGWDNGTPAATITVDPHPNMAWPDEFRREPAVYLHRLVVSRPYSRVGLGGQLLDWAGWRAWRDHGVLWVRLNAWTTNHRLHEYYRKQGFRLCGRSSDEGYPSGAMFQRPAEDTKPPKPRLFWEEPHGSG